MELFGVTFGVLLFVLGADCQCDPNPCQHDAKCEELSGGQYLCKCPPCYYGHHCDSMFEGPPACPCLNHGTCGCIDNGYTIMFRCACLSDYSGLRCEHKGLISIGNNCESDPCENGGTCQPTSSGYKCKCTPDHQGTHCQIFYNGQPCSLRPCYNGGTCIPEWDGTAWQYRCTCKPNFAGKNCENYNTLCSSYPCYNGGTCVLLKTGNRYHYRCRCLNGYTGDKCESRISPCLRNPCENGGTCVDEIGGYSCQCPCLISGEHCENSHNLGSGRDPCLSNPCQNGGFCRCISYEYTCTCAKPYYGDQCEFGSCLAKADIVFIMDTSGSIGFYGGPENYLLVKQFFKTLVDYFDNIGNIGGDDLRIAFMTFSTDVRVEFYLDPPRNAAQVKDGIDASPNMKTKTAMRKVLRVCHDEVLVSSRGDRHDNIAPDIIIFVTDGESTDGDPASAAERLKRAGVNIIMVGITDNIDEAKLRQMSSSGTMFQVDDFLSLQGKVSKLVRAACKLPGPCDINPCENDGTCVPKGTRDYDCICPCWFDGEHCQFAPNTIPLTTPCHSSPCTNGGECFCNGLGFRCKCLSPYKGTTCQDAPNPCDPNPCRNGGRCVSTGHGGYACDCINGYTDRHCQVAPNPCRPNPCENGGRCVSTGYGGYTCDCINGYTDRHCQVPPNPCYPNPCRNRGRCVSNRYGGYTCNCINGYTGRHCGVRPNPCGSKPCQNRGRCVSGGHEIYSCNCINGYTGKHCEVPPNPCEPNPCQHRGLCESTGSGSYTCDCANGYTGRNCQDVSNPCIPNRCENGGTCIAGIGGFRCECPCYITGTRCEIDRPLTAPRIRAFLVRDLTSPCLPNPCQNGATCKCISFQAKCACAAGYHGDQCQYRS